MNKYLIAIAMMLTLGLSAQAAAQNHRHHNATAVMATDDTTANDEVEAFSDTTSAALKDTMMAPVGNRSGYTVKFNGIPLPDDVVSDLFDVSEGAEGLAGIMALGVVVLVLIFFLAPVLIIALVLFFVYKNRKNRMRLAEEAMKHGQPIPDQFVNPGTSGDDHDEVRQKGIRQTCLGVGLMIFLGYTAGDIGIGIGALVTCIGIGNLLIARSQKRNSDLNRGLTERDFEH